MFHCVGTCPKLAKKKGQSNTPAGRPSIPKKIFVYSSNIENITMKENHAR